MLLNIDCVKNNCGNCVLKNNLQSKELLPMPLSQEHCFDPWPIVNNYFFLGITEGVLTKNDNSFLLGFVFVDFSIIYLRYFTHARWIDYLTENKLKIIIVCDKYLQPLANYWFRNNESIFFVIYHDDNVHNIRERLNKRFIYDRNTFHKGEALSPLEYEVLKALVSGKACNCLANNQNVNIRRVYAAKQRLENKMGTDLNTLLLSSYAMKA